MPRSARGRVGARLCPSLSGSTWRSQRQDVPQALRDEEMVGHKLGEFSPTRHFEVMAAESRRPLRQEPRLRDRRRRCAEGCASREVRNDQRAAGRTGGPSITEVDDRAHGTVTEGQYRAVHRYARVSPRKARLVADLIRARGEHRTGYPPVHAQAGQRPDQQGAEVGDCQRQREGGRRPPPVRDRRPGSTPARTFAGGVRGPWPGAPDFEEDESHIVVVEER